MSLFLFRILDSVILDKFVEPIHDLTSSSVSSVISS
ncbi:unnamed protein product [Schistosoma curassoni]|uniref:Uncharacterized protein n=1 Tax=Schistosoma curassoni TaxID=6186 RepID=A0A183JIL4_9TREM|nr:unnamed protein product [Schistosoma curassoni]